MRVTRKHVEGQGKQLKWGLESLAYFLSLDVDAPMEGQLMQHLALYSHLSSLLKDRKGTAEAKRVQTELRRDLLPIIAPAQELGSTEAYELLCKLVKKVNQMEMKPVWDVKPVDYYVEAGRDPMKGQGKYQLVKAEPGFIGPMQAEPSLGQKVLEALGYRWVVDTSGLVPASSLRKSLYWDVIESMQNGELSRLKVCANEDCQHQRFFVQEDARQRFCTNECRNEFNNRERLRSGYFSDRRKKQRTQKLNKARRLLREGKSPQQVSKETKLSLRALRRAGLFKAPSQ